jgi:hypothetical protein
MLGKSRALGKGKSAKSWQAACYQSNAEFANGLANWQEQPCLLRKLKSCETLCSSACPQEPLTAENAKGTRGEREDCCLPSGPRMSLILPGQSATYSFVRSAQ